MTTIQKMFVERTAHSIIDSGGIYGRQYQRNAERDLASEPQATLVFGEWGTEVTVSTFLHLEACLEEDKFCEEFNALPCDEWNSEIWGMSTDQGTWLEDRMFVVEGTTWNSYNWDNNFDQILQGTKLERDGEEYVILQVHGGCDARSGYTDAKLFKIQDNMNDYFMFDSSRFDLNRADAEKAGYPVQPQTYGNSDWISIDFREPCNPTIYDHRVSDEVDVPKSFWENIPHQKIEGVQDAVEH
jgi:hypothetical protein